MAALSGKGEGGRRASQVETAAEDLPVLLLATASAWSEWLATHHASSRGLWLKIAKKNSGSTSLTYAEALDGALAWGWIDGQKSTFNDVWWLQRFTPRTAKSPWSKINRAKAETLIAAGTMEAPGLAEVERAKCDGRWERAYDGARSSSVPADLVAATRATHVREPSSRRSTVRTAMQSFTACRRRRSRRRAPSVSCGSSRCARDMRRSIRDVRRSQAPAREGLRSRLAPRSREP